MMISIKQRKKLKEYLSLLAEFRINISEADVYVNEEDDDETPDEFDLDYICLGFPDDQDYTEIDIDDFYYYMSEIKSLKRIDRKTAKTKHIIQTVISSSRKGYTAFDNNLCSFTFQGDGYEVGIVERPFLIGVLNAKEHQYDDDFGFGACEPYTAIEIRSKKTINVQEAEELVERICFYLSQKLRVGIYPTEIADFEEFYYRIDEFYDFDLDNEGTRIDIASIPKYSPLLKMYRQAKSIEAPDIQFLHYYKMIEYVSQSVAKKVVYDSLKNNINILQDVEEDSGNLDVFLKAIHQYDDDIRDNSLALTVLEHCTDCKQLFYMLPHRIKEKIRSNIVSGLGAFAEENMPDSQVKSITKQLASVLYSTRNSIVHAKSNYEAKGNEIEDDDLYEANEMMAVVAGDIVKWNLNQVEGFRL